MNPSYSPDLLPLNWHCSWLEDFFASKSKSCYLDGNQNLPKEKQKGSSGLASSFDWTKRFYQKDFGFRWPLLTLRNLFNQPNILNYDVPRSRKRKTFNEYHQTRTILLITIWVCEELQKPPPHRSDNIMWERLFFETRNLCHRGVNVRLGASERTIQQFSELFWNHSTLKSRAAFSRLELSSTAVHHILCYCFLFLYKPPNLRALNGGNKHDRAKFCATLLYEAGWLLRTLIEIVNSDEWMFRIENVVIKRKVGIWGVERPVAHNSLVMKSPNAMPWCAY